VHAAGVLGSIFNDVRGQGRAGAGGGSVMRVLLLWLLLGALTAWMVDLAFEAALPAQTLIATLGDHDERQVHH